ncbi:MAG: gamma-glutamyltransferase [Gammaproteobacteria bacterium]|nr:MAG: gamma-glutamyltransferase [Gammaproteobacteria bacterium]RKZ96359.1 MAG: gamma-glutamyltransferase [Gammaproteobacteria bacterium]
MRCHLRYLSLLFCLLISQASTGKLKHHAAIASAHPLATQAGFEILNLGGNAFDAAIAVSAVLAVVEPSGSGLGGGGFWLLHRASDNFEVMIDGRETAPNAAHRDMYLDQQGNVDKRLSLDGALAAAIPGMPAALDHISKHYGHLSLKQTLEPAIRYAKQGFHVTQHYQKLAKFRLNTLNSSVDSQAIFLRNGDIPDINTLITQADLANTLIELSKHGRDGFYQGIIAQKLVSGVQQAAGIWTLQDLKNYQVKERPPIIGSFKGYKITSASPPSSGGIVLVSMLNQLENLPISESDRSQKRHLIVEAMRRAYFDRSRYLGDADFITIPTTQLTSKAYGQQLATSIDLQHATNNNKLSNPAINKGEDTTHFSIIDRDGNRVSATLSINYPFGSGFIPPGTGVLLNDEMDDFSAKIDSANAYGLTGNQANAIAANKRPLSSMTPTFIENDDRLMIIGTPGGSRIISMVLLGILDFVDGLDAQTIVSNPRFHHQYLPDQIQVESIGFTSHDLESLEQHGHSIQKLSRQYGNMQVIIQNKITKQLTAASDPRGEGSSLVK